MRFVPMRGEREIELSIGPHTARPGWRVLRVSFATCSLHERRIARALDALFAPAPDDDGLSGSLDESTQGTLSNGGSK
jgi:hypothetical protein